MTMKKCYCSETIEIIHRTNTLVNSINTLFYKKVHSCGSAGGSGGCMVRIPSMWINRAAEIL